MAFYNVHTHIFNKDYMPSAALGQYVGQGVGKRIDPILRTRWGRALLIRADRTLMRFNQERLANFVGIARLGMNKSMEENLLHLIQQYGQHPDAKFVILPMLMEYMTPETSTKDEAFLKTIAQQMDDIIHLARFASYANVMLPFVAIDPRMSNSGMILAFVKDYLRKGCVGVKLYPALGYYPFDPNLHDTFEFCAKNQIPILTHVNDGGAHYESIPNDRQLNAEMHPAYKDFTDISKHNQLPQVYAVHKKKQGDWTEFFTDPGHWEPVLKAFPDLKVCMAHFGGKAEIVHSSKFAPEDEADAKALQSHKRKVEERTNKFKVNATESWAVTICRLMSTYKNVYADVSYIHSEPETFPFLHSLLKWKDENGKAPGREKLLFGSDFYVNLSNGVEKDTVPKFFEYLRSKFGAEYEQLFSSLTDHNPRAFLYSPEYYPVAQEPSRSIV